MTRITKLTELAPVVAVAKARHLDELGWRVCITDKIGRQFKPADFDMLLDCLSVSQPQPITAPGRVNCKTALHDTGGNNPRRCRSQAVRQFISTDRALATQRSFR
jgi:hypothetical protein